MNKRNMYVNLTAVIVIAILTVTCLISLISGKLIYAVTTGLGIFILGLVMFIANALKLFQRKNKK